MKITKADKIGIGLISDDDPSKLSKKAFDSYLGHFPSGTSFQCINHFRQLVLAKRFQKYDYGREKNLQIYDSETPPEIPVSGYYDVPIALMCGQSDKLASAPDYVWLRDNLLDLNCLKYYKEYDYGHVAFLMPPNKRQYLDMLELIKHFNPYFVET